VSRGEPVNSSPLALEKTKEIYDTDVAFPLYQIEGPSVRFEKPFAPALEILPPERVTQLISSAIKDQDASAITSLRDYLQPLLKECAGKGIWMFGLKKTHEELQDELFEFLVFRITQSKRGTNISKKNRGLKRLLEKALISSEELEKFVWRTATNYLIDERRRQRTRSEHEMLAKSDEDYGEGPRENLEAIMSVRTAINDFAERLDEDEKRFFMALVSSVGQRASLIDEAELLDVPPKQLIHKCTELRKRLAVFITRNYPELLELLR
jgi:hypothetical protein